VRSNGPLSGCEHGGEEVRRRIWQDGCMSKDAPVNRGNGPVGEPTIDRPPADSRIKKLRASDKAALSPAQGEKFHVISLHVVYRTPAE
jgi:hypothetical protein